MKLVLTLAITIFTSLPAMAGQALGIDTLGQKGGVLEALYSEAGRKQMLDELALVFSKEGDTAYFIFEMKDYSYAVLFANYKNADGTIRGNAEFRYRNKKGTAACEPAMMSTNDINYRADTCYYNDAEYLPSFGFPALSYKSDIELVESVIPFLEEIGPLQSKEDFMKAHATLWAEFEAAVDTYRNSKMAPFIATALIVDSGWGRDFTVPTGWAPTTKKLTDAQAKILSGIRRLQADDRVYLSVNVVCDSSTVKSSNIMDRKAITGQCDSMYLMGEMPDRFYQSMEAAGYKYDEVAREWK